MRFTPLLRLTSGFRAADEPVADLATGGLSAVGSLVGLAVATHIYGDETSTLRGAAAAQDLVASSSWHRSCWSSCWQQRVVPS
jgi:hypothetical protein